MRRAALVAIAIVLGLLLLILRGTDRARSARSPPVRIDEPLGPSAREAPEPEAAGHEAASPAEPDATAGGRVTDANGRPLAGLRLLAIPRDHTEMWDAEDPCTPPGEAPEVPFAHTDPDGVFAFRGLPRGDYRLAIDERDWTLGEPAFFRADTADLRVVGVRALSAEARVRDLATQERIARFSVRYRLPQNAAEERVGHGSDGLFRLRVRQLLPREAVKCLVEAEGYHGATAWLSTRERADVWLVRAGEPRLLLRVAFEDGSPCEEEAEVGLWHLGRRVALAATRTGAGRYQVTIPAGTWTVEFSPAKSPVFRKPCTAKVDMAEGERREVFLELERGGDILLTRRGWDGKVWFLEVRSGRSIEPTSAQGEVCELRHLTPGTYTLTVHDPSRGGEGDTNQVWAREIEVTTGSRHELTVE